MIATLFLPVGAFRVLVLINQEAVSQAVIQNHLAGYLSRVSNAQHKSPARRFCFIFWFHDMFVYLIIRTTICFTDLDEYQGIKNEAHQTKPNQTKPKH
jgi:hypothetical protein